jgi:hypothetical protein
LQISPTPRLKQLQLQQQAQVWAVCIDKNIQTQKKLFLYGKSFFALFIFYDIIYLEYFLIPPTFSFLPTLYSQTDQREEKR